ncbi:unnamed protein product [Blepharisma stoltei]|uniref:Endonuclease/exonuclease/phosphatase domain-containing protein n=1 Tax=Blepharisma stoltei TaxID=1481888 RepID=A0AAU9KSC1_9CILI|nr:unnamed protein product [Blepharisma stoltei]
MEGRVIAIEFGKIALIVAYSPVESSYEEETEAFYDGLYAAVAWSRRMNKQEILMGDFNAHLKGWWSKDTNQNGHRLRTMCLQWDQDLLQLNLHSAGNTFCLDYAAVNRGLADKLIDFDVDGDCPIESDHLPITLKIWDWNTRTGELKKRKLRVDRLQNPIFRKLYQSELYR